MIDYTGFGTCNNMNLMPNFKYMQHQILENGTFSVLFITEGIFTDEYKAKFLTLRQLIDLKPTQTLKEHDIQVIAN